jgi:hypothetical protein
MRVRPQLKKALLEMAAADGRTLASYCERVLEAHLAEGKPRQKRRI